MKRINQISILVMLMLTLMNGLLSCRRDKEENIQYYYLPSMVGYDVNMDVVTLITPFGTFLAPQLNDHYIFALMDGDALWTHIIVNWDDQHTEDYTTVVDIGYIKLYKDIPQAVEGGKNTTDDFDAPIENVEPLALLFDNYFNNYVAFFVFTHTVHGSTRFAYEMTYDPEDESDIPTIYFKAKEDDTGTLPIYAFEYYYAFDFKDFLLERENPDKLEKINIMFYTGTDMGEDVYKPWSGNPLELDFEKK